MADTTPISNQINVDLSSRVDDAVTGADNGIAAVKDGAVFSALLRNQYVAQACRAMAVEKQ